jgi:di/tricarboxylate transporter
MELGSMGFEAAPKPQKETSIAKLVEKSGANPEKRMERGDHIVFDAPKDFWQKNKHLPDFITVTRLSEAPKQVDLAKAYTAGAIMAVMIVLVASSTLQLLEAVLLALGALVITDCAKLEAVRSYVKLSTVLTIVGAFGLGKAIGQEKVASALADLLLWLLAPFGTPGLLTAIFLATIALGVVFHGTAVVVLMYPVCEVAASKQDLPIHMVVGLLCIAVALQVLSPISYQTNMMAYSAGGYEFTDFTLLGSGLVFVIGMTCIPLCQFWYA